MRVIGGKHKGTRLKTRKSNATRPLLARVKKSLFSILQPHIPESKFLDLFAGSGSVGIEALSRGAHSCLFVDQNEQCTTTIRENLKHLGLQDKGRTMKKKVSTALNILEEEEQEFDIIYIGPPYKSDFASKTVKRLGNSKIIHENSLVIAEVRKGTPIPETSGRLTCIRRETYGDTALHFFQVLPR